MKNHNYKTVSILFALASCLAASSSAAQTILSDDFNSYTAGNNIPSSTSDTAFNWFARDTGSGRSNTVELDSGDVFGEGTGNKYLQMTRDDTATADSNITSNLFAEQLTGQISFDYYVADAADISGDKGFRLTLQNVGSGKNPFNSNNNNTLGGLFMTGTDVVRRGTNNTLDASNKFAYTAGQKNTLSIVFNNSASTLNYDSTSVASGKLDIYLNGTIAGTWDLSQGSEVGVGTGTTGLWLQLPSGTEGNILFDNLNFSAIPEPSTYTLLAGLTGLALAMVRRRM